MRNQWNDEMISSIHLCMIHTSVAFKCSAVCTIILTKRSSGSSSILITHTELRPLAVLLPIYLTYCSESCLQLYYCAVPADRQHSDVTRLEREQQLGAPLPCNRLHHTYNMYIRSQKGIRICCRRQGLSSFFAAEFPYCIDLPWVHTLQIHRFFIFYMNLKKSCNQFSIHYKGGAIRALQANQLFIINSTLTHHNNHAGHTLHT